MFIFHKTEVQTVILRCLTSVNLNWYKRHDTKRKNAKNTNVWFCTKSQKTWNGNICVFCHNFLTNQNLDQLSISKWPSEPQLCERWTYIWQKIAKNGRNIVIYLYLSFRIRLYYATLNYEMNIWSMYFHFSLYRAEVTKLLNKSKPCPWVLRTHHPVEISVLPW